MEIRKDSVTGIVVKTEPANKVYYIGVDTVLNLVGGVITATWENGNRPEDVDMSAAGVEFAGFDPETAGAQIITVSYEGKSATFEVEVKNDSVTNLVWGRLSLRQITCMEKHWSLKG